MKKPVIAFTIATDPANQEHAKKMINSLRKFHTEEELPIMVIDNEIMNRSGDPEKFFKATPMIAKDLIKEYDKVIQINADCIITGDLKHIITDTDKYDAGVVLNYSRLDINDYGPITVAKIDPTEYLNNGFIVLRSEEFVNHWWNLCNHPHFGRYQYREQDLLNLMAFYGNWTVKCLDYYDQKANYSAWHGLMWKGETPKMKLVDGKIMLPKGEDNYPDRDVEVKILHWAGGNLPKLNYRILFNDEIIKRIDYLISEVKVCTCTKENGVTTVAASNCPIHYSMTRLGAVNDGR